MNTSSQHYVLCLSRFAVVAHYIRAVCARESLLEFELWLSVFSDNHCSGYAIRLIYSFLKVEFALELAMKAQS